MAKRLTAYSRCAGCAGKLAAGELARVLGGLPVRRDDRVLVDYRTSDDAGVYRLDAERALVQTVDFFTSVVDDPFLYGQIAAANALSDVYAMGGRPLTALAIAAFPEDGDRALLESIFAGGLDKLCEAGVALLGGHTVRDEEIKFGYAVTGEVHPERFWTNAGALPGDVLFVTKAIGTGVIATALKFDRATPAAIAGATTSMLTLNRAACEALRALPPGAVHACTDVTGFGLLGHASEVATASGCTVEIDSGAVPLLPGARELAPTNVSGGGRTNAEHFGPGVSGSMDLPPALALLFHDPQTSGGLLVAVDSAHGSDTEALFAAAGVPLWRVGCISPASPARVRLTH